MKQISIKQASSLLFAFVACVVYGVSSLNDTKTVSLVTNASEQVEIVLMNEYKENVPFTVTIDKQIDQLSRVNETFELMRVNNNVLDGFTGLLPQGVQVNQINEDNKCLTIDFNDKINEFNPAYEVKMIEAIIYVCSQFDGVEQLKFTIEEHQVNQLKNGKVPLNQNFKVSNILNSFETLDASFHRANNVVVVIPKVYGQMNYMTYQLVKSNEDTTTCLNKYYTHNNSIFINSQIHFKIFNIQIENGCATLNISDEILQDDKSCNTSLIEPILFTIDANYDVEEIKVVVEDIEIYRIKCDDLRINEISL